MFSTHRYVVFPSGWSVTSSFSAMTSLTTYTTEITTDTKVEGSDPFLHYSNLGEVPSDMPAVFRSQLHSLRPFLSPNASVVNLASCHRDSSGTLVYDGPVVHRPWEWIENLGEPTQPDSKDEGHEREDQRVKYMIKNSGSLNLETFGARLTGDRIIQTASDGHDVRIKQNMRSFEDRLSAESIFPRDWRETRVDVEHVLPPDPYQDSGEGIAEAGVDNATSDHTRNEKRTPRASPASASGPSRHGSAAAGTLHKHSTSTISDVVEVDSIGSGSSSRRASASNKRKAPIEGEEDIIIVDGASKLKKPKVVKASKAKTKKR